MTRTCIGFLCWLAVSLASAEPPISIAPSSPPTSARPLISSDLLEAYAQLTGKTILASPGLPKPNATLSPELQVDTNRAIAFIEAEFAKHGIEAVGDGEKFVQLLPRVSGHDFKLPEHVARIKKPRPGGEVIPTGSITWISADMESVLAIYSDLTERNLIRALNLPTAPLYFRNQCPLTRDEVVYAVKVLLAYNHVTVIEDGDRLAQLVHSAAASNVEPRAPKPEKGAKLIDPRKLPEFMRLSSVRTKQVRNPQTPTEKALAELKGLYARARKALFGPPPPPLKPELDNFVAFYATLIDAKPIPSERFGKHPMLLDIRIPLTKAELLYAIEATLALSGFHIVPTNQNSIHVVRFDELRKARTKSPAAREP